MSPSAAARFPWQVGTGAAVVVENTYGWRDIVVWNPFETLKDCYQVGGSSEGSAAEACCASWLTSMPHIPATQRFVAVESARVKPVKLAPSYVWTGETNLTVIDL